MLNLGSDNFVRLNTKDSSIVQSAKTSSESNFVLDWWSAKGGQQMQGEVENTSKMSRIYTNAVQTSDYRTMLSYLVQGHQLGPLNQCAVSTIYVRTFLRTYAARPIVRMIQ